METLDLLASRVTDYRDRLHVARIRVNQAIVSLGVTTPGLLPSTETLLVKALEVLDIDHEPSYRASTSKTVAIEYISNNEDVFETTVLRLLAQGRAMSQIANILKVPLPNVERAVKSLKKDLKAKNTAHLIHRAWQEGWLSDTDREETWL